MKRNLLTLLLWCFYLTIDAQSSIQGQYKYFTDNIEKLPFNYTLSLNCDKTFIIQDSTTNSIGTGTWKIKKDTTLILSIHSTGLQNSKSSKKMRLTYFIQNGQLHEEVMTKKQYDKQNKKLDKQLQSCMPGMWEEYDTFKAKQQSRYLIKVNSLQCP
jgi:hypothetical protein